MPLDLFQELTHLAATFDEVEIEYAVVGALALALHGVPRATTDIDLLIRPEVAGAAVDLAKSRGFLIEALPIRFSDGMEIRRLSKIEEADPHETLTLDLLLVDRNLEEVWNSRLRLETELGALWVISRTALIRMKTWAGRERDLADIRRLQELDR